MKTWDKIPALCFIGYFYIFAFHLLMVTVLNPPVK